MLSKMKPCNYFFFYSKVIWKDIKYHLCLLLILKILFNFNIYYNNILSFFQFFFTNSYIFLYEYCGQYSYMSIVVAKFKWSKLVFISKINAMFTWALKPNKIPKHRLIWWRNVGSLTFFVCMFCNGAQVTLPEIGQP